MHQTDIINNSLSSKQINILVGSLTAEQLQSYITKLQAIKAASNGIFNETAILKYSYAIQGLEAKQAALLLSTQGLTNAQIAETLAVNESNIATNYQAMAEAGLLANKQKLTIAQVQENLQTVLGAEADTSAAMASLGLSSSIEGQEHQTVQLTAKKLQEAVATNVLTEAQAQEFAMRSGITFAMQKQAASTLPKWIATLQAATKAVWGQVKATAVWLATTPAGWATAAIAAIGAVILGLNKYAKAAKKASDEALEAYEKAKDKVQSNKEEAKSLDELIKKYEELKSSSDMDSGTRNEIKELQYDIMELVGAEVQNLDLVNGALDEQLAKLKEITAEKAKSNLEDARNSYYKAVHLSDTMVGDSDDYGNDVNVKWVGTEANQIHKVNGFKGITYKEFIDYIIKSGFGDIFRENQDSNIFNMKFVVDTKDIDGLEAKVKRLEEFKEFLAGNNLRNTDLYQGVVDAIERYESQSGYELEAANNLMDSVIDNLSIANKKLSDITVDSMDTFEQYRQTMLSEAESDETIGEALADGILSQEAIEKAVNDFMATTEGFSEWYVKWQESMKGTDVSIDISFSDQLTTSKESLDQFQSSVKSASEAYATLLSGNYSSSELLDSIQTINEAVTDMKGSIHWEEIGSLDELGDKLEEISKSYAESILSGVGIKVNSDFGQMLANIIQQMYEVEAQFNGMNTQLDRLQSSYKTLTGILESYNETGYISLDNLQSLLTADENLISMLEVENGQLTINQEAYENLVAVQLQEFKEKLNNAAAAEIEALALNKAEEATNNNAQASEDAIEKLDAETEAFKRNTEAVSENALTKAMTQAEEAGVSKEEIQGVLDKYTKIWNAAMDNYSKDFPTFMKGAESAGKDAGKAFTEALDKELNALDTKMDAGYIDFNDYIQARLDLIEDYYRQGKIKADAYYSYLEKHYDKQITYMDKAANAVTRRIDKEIDALEKQKDDVESIYQVQIDALEKQKTLLEEANQERQQQVDLQKALYDMERAENQRTKLTYTEDKGMIYNTDPSAIRDAKANVDDTRYEIQISQIEKMISKLEEARDNETDAIDDMISKLNEYKDAWNSITSAYAEKQENLIAAQILGSGWEADILNGRLDVLDAFKNQYIDIQQAIVDAAWMSANEQVKAAKEAGKGASGRVSNAPTIEDKYNFVPLTQTNKASGYTGRLDTTKVSHAQSFQKYGTGTNNAKKGLNLVGEDGTEAYFDNHGHAAIVTEPTLIPMEGGEVVKNEKDTRKLLDSDNLSPANTLELADIDGKEAEYTIKVNIETNGNIPAFSNNTDISQEEYIRYLQQISPNHKTKQLLSLNEPERLEVSVKSLEHTIKEMMNPTHIIAQNMQEMASIGKYINDNSVSNVINNNKNIQPTVTFGDIHVTCPGVTEQQVAEKLPGVLNRTFSGFSNLADQYSRT